jgi:hypothetical protein
VTVKVLGIRFCTVGNEAKELAAFLKEGLGLPTLPGSADSGQADSTGFEGAVFPAGESWIEVWPEGPDMPAGIMLQVVVDDADQWAAQARRNGLEPDGPVDAHGERIYFLEAPGGLFMSFQSATREPDVAV